MNYIKNHVKKNTKKWLLKTGVVQITCKILKSFSTEIKRNLILFTCEEFL